MGYQSPLRNQQTQWVAKQTELFADRVSRSDRSGTDSGAESARFELACIPYGPDGASEDTCCEIVESYGPIEPEYASMRRCCGLLDATHRSVIVLTGSDRLDFLDRMITQGVATLEAGRTTRSFWLNRKGASSRIFSWQISPTGPCLKSISMRPRPHTIRWMRSCSPRMRR